jgi:hypothetical protein
LRRLVRLNVAISALPSVLCIKIPFGHHMPHTQNSG